MNHERENDNSKDNNWDKGTWNNNGWMEERKREERGTEVYHIAKPNEKQAEQQGQHKSDTFKCQVMTEKQDVLMEMDCMRLTVHQRRGCHEKGPHWDSSQ